MRPNPLDTAGQQFVSQFERLYEAESSDESKSEDESESENIEENPWSDPAKIGFNRGFEPLKIHESVQDSDDQSKWALLRSTRKTVLEQQSR